MARIIRRPPNVNQFGSTLELFRLKKFFDFWISFWVGESQKWSQLMQEALQTPG